jgi:hypothetical protein
MVQLGPVEGTAIDTGCTRATADGVITFCLSNDGAALLAVAFRENDGGIFRGPEGRNDFMEFALEVPGSEFATTTSSIGVLFDKGSESLEL